MVISWVHFDTPCKWVEIGQTPARFTTMRRASNGLAVRVFKSNPTQRDFHSTPSYQPSGRARASTGPGHRRHHRRSRPGDLSASTVLLRSFHSRAAELAPISPRFHSIEHVQTEQYTQEWKPTRNSQLYFPRFILDGRRKLGAGERATPTGGECTLVVRFVLLLPSQQPTSEKKALIRSSCGTGSRR